jgi:DNA sulfur modification protein DndB
MANKVIIRTLPSLQEASEASSKMVSEIGARAFPVTLFKQGNREFLSAVFPIMYIVNELKTNSIEKGKGVKDARSAMNRPLDLPHAKITKDYIERNYKSTYILPAMTLNIQDQVEIFTADFPGSYVKPAYMVIPYGIKFSVTDGQHRKKALEDLCNELSPEDYNKIKNDGICVMITIEDDINQIHQDFADCSKTKPLPKSMIAVYDKRNPANSLVLDLIEACPLFKNKVDATRQTLSKKSVMLLLVSQVRSLTKELILGNSATGDADFEARMQELYKDANSDVYRENVEKFIDFINKITNAIGILKEISLMKEGVEMSKIPILRSEYLILNSAGLNIIGRIANELFKAKSLPEEIDIYIDRLSKIDWKKDAEIWRGNIVTEGGKGLKISTSNSTTKAAVAKVKEIIELDKQTLITKPAEIE